MIYLFNLNNYVGGGEVYILQLAKYLFDKNISFKLITSKDGYIHKEAIRNDFEIIVWPVGEDSILYASSLEKKIIKDFFKSLNISQNDVVLACNMRELYNSIFLIKALKKKIILKNIILHPEEYKYASSLSIFPSKTINNNRSLLIKLDSSNLNIYPNKNAQIKSIGKDMNDNDYYPFPIDVEKNTNLSYKKSFEKINLLTISRFVSFKISTTISLIKLVRKNNKFNLTIVGYGPWKFLIKLYLFFFKCDRVKIYPKQKLEDLKQFILNCDIGFAQGTTILQIAKYSKPVIVAPYSKWYDFLFKKIKSPQVFGENDIPHFGDEYYKKSKNYYDYLSLINKILSDYNLYVNKTKIIVSSLSSENIFAKLLNKLYEKEYLDDYENIHIPKPNYFKKLVRKIIFS